MFHIIGAGPAGISIAYYLNQSGYDKIAIHEQNDFIGGLARSWNHNGFTLDTGPHIFHTEDKEVENDWNSIGKNLFSFGNFRSCNILEKYPEVLFDYPLSIETLKKNLENEFFKEVNFELDNLPSQESFRNAATFKEFMEGKVGKKLSELFFTEYPQKLWGLKTDQMLADWAPQRIELRKKSGPFYQKPFVAVGKYGTGSFYQKIIDLLNNKKSLSLNLKNKLIRVEHKRGKITNLIFNNNKNIKISNEDYVISTIPASVLANLLGVNLSLKFRGVRSQYLFFKNDRILPDRYNWVYCSDKNYSFNRITEPSSMSKELSPKGYSYLCVETTFDGNKKDPIFNGSFNEIINWIRQNKSFNSKGYIPELNTENFEPFVYPIQDKLFRSEISKYNSVISNFQNLSVLGTGGEFHYSDMQIIFRKSKKLVKSFDNQNLNKIPMIKLLKNESESEFLTKRKSTTSIYLSKLHEISKVEIPLIAEIGINHNGDINLAKKMMIASKKSGCNFAKFQYYQKDVRIQRNEETEFLHETADGTELSLNDVLERSRLNEEDCIELINYGKSINLPVFFTVFDVESALKIKNIGQKIVKVASMDCNNYDLHSNLNSLGFETVIISTGMSDIREVSKAISIYDENIEILIMSCRSSYPTSLEDVDLGEITYLKEKTGCQVGYSDHTEGELTSLLSIACGATFIERHFTTNKEISGPDNKMSINESETKSLTNKLEVISKSIKRRRKIIHPCEQSTFSMQKKSLRFHKNLKKGEVFNFEDLVHLAPPIGYSDFHSRIKNGQYKVLKNVKKGDPINELNIKSLF